MIMVKMSDKNRGNVPGKSDEEICIRNIEKEGNSDITQKEW